MLFRSSFGSRFENRNTFYYIFNSEHESVNQAVWPESANESVKIEAVLFSCIGLAIFCSCIE